MSETKDYSAFLRDLEALAAKHRFVIGGCGCCGSPWVIDSPNDPEKGFYIIGGSGGDDLTFVHPSDEYNWKKYGKENNGPSAGVR